MRISDWSSDVCSSDLGGRPLGGLPPPRCQRLTDALSYPAGRWTVKVAPSPGVDDTSTEPPWDRATASTIDRPRPLPPPVPSRSEERRVGKEGFSTCRSRWSRDN